MPTKTTPTTCLCGCGTATKGGRFNPGHDAKLKYRLISEALAGKKRAEKELEKFGWLAHLTRKRQQIEAEKLKLQRRNGQI